QMVVIEIEFDERDPLFKCCCGIFHVKTGTRILSVINVLISTGLAFQLFFFPYNWLWSIIEYSSATANVISSASMFIATFTFRPKMVIGYLATQLIILIFTGLLFTACMVSIIIPESVGRFVIEHLSK
ncbi:hypothetical protein PENTCL1PPCAC_6717, partial [Pristionchus entomophagus]